MLTVQCWCYWTEPARKGLQGKTILFVRPTGVAAKIIQGFRAHKPIFNFIHQETTTALTSHPFYHKMIILHDLLHEFPHCVQWLLSYRLFFSGVLIVLCKDLHCISSFKIHYGQVANKKREGMRVQAIHALVQLLGYFHVSWLH